LVCCQRYARGVSSGAYDGRGSTVMRSRGAAKNAWGAARVCYRAPAWSKNSGAVVGSRSLWTPFGSRAECNRPARPCEHRRPETYAIAPQTWEPVRVPLGGPAGGRPRRRPDQRRPLLLQPGEALRGIAMSRHNPGLVKRAPPVGPQRTPSLAVGEHAARTPEQPPAQDGSPPSRLTAHDERPGLQQRNPALLLRGGALRSTPTAMAGAHTLQAVPQQGPVPVREPGDTEAPARAPDRHGHGVPQEVAPHRRPPHQPPIVCERGLWPLGVSRCDRRSTALYSATHGCILLGSGDRNVSCDIHPGAHGRQP